MIKIKKVRPMFTRLITTMNKYEDDGVTKSGLIDVSKAAGTLKEYQTVVAVGTMVMNIKEGDVVWINPQRYAVMKHKKGSFQDGVISDNPVIDYKFNTIEIDGVTYLMLDNGDIEFVVEDYEEVEEPKKEPASTLYMPPKPTILVP